MVKTDENGSTVPEEDSEIKVEPVETEKAPKKEIGSTAKIIIAGPPHSGKSVGERFIRSMLPPQETMRIASQPDGEGDWTQNLYGQDAELAQQLKNKGIFSKDNVEHWKAQISNSNSRFSLIDVGGVVSPENREICDQANAMIIISSNREKIQEWVKLANETGLNILAVLHSTLDETQTETFAITPGQDWESEGVVVGLDRGKFKDSATLRKLAAYLLDRVPPKEKYEFPGYEFLGIDSVAEMIGKKPEDIVLPGREPIKSLNWKPEELPAVYNALQRITERGGSFVIDGRAPQFLVVNILHALHPNKVAVADSKVEGGMVGISGINYPKGEGSGPLPWVVTEDFQGGTLVEYAKDEFTIISSEKLGEVIPPETKPGKPVFLSGKTSNWASAEIALSYAHVVPAVYLYQPGTGFICVVSHSIEHKLGSVIEANPPRSTK